MSSEGLVHVALCTDGIFPLATGGMQRHSRLLAEHLARSGKVRLSVLHPHNETVFAPELGIQELHVQAIDPDRLYLGELWRYSGRVAGLLDQMRPDVILSQGFSVWKDMDHFAGQLVVNPHGLEMFQGITLKDKLVGLPFRIALGRILRRSTFAVSLGGGLTPMLAGIVSNSPAKVVVLPNAVDVPERPPDVPDPDGELRLLFVGRFAFNKGIDVLMNVARRLEHSGQGRPIRFDLAGDGPLMEKLKQGGLPGNVRLLGRVDDDALLRLYSECHALVLPTRFEGMPTVVLEAMAHARPVLVSDVGATAELVDHTNGALLPAGDEEALLAAIRELASMDTGRLVELGRASYERVKERFSWPTVTKATLDFIMAIDRERKGR